MQALLKLQMVIALFRYAYIYVYSNFIKLHWEFMADLTSYCPKMQWLGIWPWSGAPVGWESMLWHRGQSLAQRVTADLVRLARLVNWIIILINVYMCQMSRHLVRLISEFPFPRWSHRWSCRCIPVPTTAAGRQQDRDGSLHSLLGQPGFFLRDWSHPGGRRGIMADFAQWRRYANGYSLL